jgi:hypothetical protein
VTKRRVARWRRLRAECGDLPWEEQTVIACMRTRGVGEDGGLKAAVWVRTPCWQLLMKGTRNVHDRPWMMPRVMTVRSSPT